MNKYYAMHNGYNWHVKDGEFFEQQGGLTEEWGKNWKCLYATSIEHARDLAKLRFGGIERVGV